MKRSPVLVLALAVVVSLSACSSSAPSSAPALSTAPSSAPSSTPAPSASTTSATPGTTTSTSGGASVYPAAEVCAFLTQQIPVLQGVGSPVGAHASLVGNLFGFLQTHSAPLDGSALEAATSAQCPEVRTQVLTLTGLASLADL